MGLNNRFVFGSVGEEIILRRFMSVMVVLFGMWFGIGKMLYVIWDMLIVEYWILVCCNLLLV